MNLLCAVCLYRGGRDGVGGSDAVTIANSQAVCLEHFKDIHLLVAPDYGPIALAALRNPDVQRGSTPQTGA